MRSGQGGRLREWKDGRGPASAFLLVVLAWLVLPPLGTLIVTSLHGTTQTGALGRFTWHYFASVWGHGQMGPLLGNTLGFSVGSGALALALGMVEAWLVERTDAPGRGLLTATAVMSLAVPYVLYTMAWILVLGNNGPFNQWIGPWFGSHNGRWFHLDSLPGMALVEGFLWSPLVFLLLSSVLRNFDPRLEEASWMAGATPGQTVRGVATDPKWRFALGARPENVGCLIQAVSEDGTVGYGYAGEIPHLGYSAAVVEEVVRHLAEQAVGAEVDDWRVLLGLLGREWSSCAPAVAGLEVALLDLVAKVHHLPLYRYLGGAFREQVPILRILPLKSPEETAEGAMRLVEAGFSYLKIKLENRDMALDIARIRAVREAVGPEMHLTLDANQSYSPKEAVRLWEAIGDLGIDLFEQPVPTRDFEGLKFVTDRVGYLVEADESAESLEDIWRLGEMRAVDCVSLKLLKLGGPSNLAKAAAICEQAGIGYRIGATMGTQLLNAAAMHLAATLPSLSYACELGEYLRLTNDPFGGLDLRDGVLFLPQREGLGVSLTSKEAME